MVIKQKSLLLYIEILVKKDFAVIVKYFILSVSLSHSWVTTICRVMGIFSTAFKPRQSCKAGTKGIILKEHIPKAFSANKPAIEV